MSNVIEFPQNIEDPHLMGTVKCMACGNVWSVVAPVGIVDTLECCDCGANKGVMMEECLPEEYWECQCGNYRFAIRPDGYAICCNCGLAQDFADV